MKKIAVIFVFSAAFLASLGYARREWVLMKVGGFLVSEDPLIRADAIAVLSGNSPYRILGAVDLYQKQFAPRILLTETYEEGEHQDLMKSLGVTYHTSLEVNRRIAVHQGVPADAIVALPETNSTKSEAEAVLAFLQKRNLRSVIVVTSGYHSTRTRLIFRSLNGQGVRVAVHPSRHDPFFKRSWWRNRYQSKQVFYEYVKLINHYLVGF